MTARSSTSRRRYGVGFYLGYAELTERPEDAPLQHRDPRRRRTGEIVGKYRKVHLPGHAEHKPQAAFQHLEKKYFEVGDLGFRAFRMHGHGDRAC